MFCLAANILMPTWLAHTMGQKRAVRDNYGRERHLQLLRSTMLRGVEQISAMCIRVDEAHKWVSRTALSSGDRKSASELNTIMCTSRHLN